MQSMGPLSQCCLFSPMDHVHPCKGVRYIPLKVARDPQRGWVWAGGLSNFSLVSTCFPIPPHFPNTFPQFSPLFPHSPHFSPFSLFSHFSSGMLLGTLAGCVRNFWDLMFFFFPIETNERNGGQTLPRGSIRFFPKAGRPFRWIVVSQ